MNHKVMKRNGLTLALAMVLAAPTAALAQNSAQTPPPTSTDDKDKKADDLGNIVVTGSRIKRAEVEGPAPVTIITGEQMRREGFATAYDAISTLTEAIGVVQADAAWGSHTVNANAINLRNMGPGRSLLLVNGHRVPDYPLPMGGKSNFANYSNLPTAMIDRVEVLATGASAIYGSDAVAGVVNVILKKNFVGDEMKIRFGDSTNGGRLTKDFSWTGGRGTGNWNVTYGLQYFDRQPLLGRDRPAFDHDDDADPRSWNDQARKAGFLVPTAIRLLNTDTGQRTVPPGNSCDQFNGAFYKQHRLVWDNQAQKVVDTGWQCGMAHTFALWGLRTGESNKSGYVNARYDFGNGLEAWASVGIWDSMGKSSGNYVPATAVYTYRDADTGSQMNIVRRITAAELGGDDSVFTRSHERSWDLRAGIRGRMLNGRYDWDLSLGRSQYRIDERFPALLEAEAKTFFLGNPVATINGQPAYRLNTQRLWNPMSLAEARSITTQGLNRSSSWANEAQFTVSGELARGWAGPIGVAGVAEWASQGYTLSPDPNADVGASPRYFSPMGIRDEGGGTRKRYAVGAEFKVPIVRTLTATLAARYDKYMDASATGGAPTWNAGIEWRPTKSLLIRGNYATSFRAPDMHYLFAKDSQSIADLTDYAGCIGAGHVRDCRWETDEFHNKGEDVTVYRKGSPDLEEEKGKSFSYGVVWDAAENLSMSVDYWSIKLNNIIDDLDANRTLLDEAGCKFGITPDGAPWNGVRGGDYCSIIQSRIVRGSDGRIVSVRVGPVNQAMLHAKGLDASLRYRYKTNRFGTFLLAGNYTNQLRYNSQFKEGEPIEHRRDDQIRAKFRGSVTWDMNKWLTTLYVDRLGSVYGNGKGNCEFGTSGANCPRVWKRLGPFTTANLNVAYRFNDQATLSLFVRNMTNYIAKKDPWKMDFVFTNMEIADFVGREVAIEFRYRFK